MEIERHLTTRGLGPAIVAVLFVILGESAGACTCRYTPFEGAREFSSVIALVEVESIRPTQDRIGGEGQDVELKVHATWKGSYSGRQRIEGGSLCGFWFKPGEHYLLYASDWKGNMRTSLCTRTKEYSRAGEDIGKLGIPHWTDSANFKLLPRENAGLSISIRAVKQQFTIFDDPAFDLTLRNESANSIRLPLQDGHAKQFVTLVVEKNGKWWGSLTEEQLKEFKLGDSGLSPKQRKTVRLTLRGNHLNDLGEYSVRAVVHNSTRGLDLWTGYIFSEPIKISKVQHKDE